MGADHKVIHSAHVGRLCTLCGAAPFLFALLTFVVMAALCSVNLIIVPVTEGSGGQFEDIAHINARRHHAAEMLQFRSGSENIVFDRQSVSTAFTDVMLMYHIRDQYSATVEGKPLLTDTHIAGIRAFEEKLMKLSGFYNANTSTSSEVRCLLKPKEGVTPPVRDLTTCTESIYNIPEGFECVLPRSITDEYATGPPFLPPGATRASASAGRSTISFGLPLPCLPNAIKDADGDVDPKFQSDNFTEWFGDVLMPFLEGEGQDDLNAIGVNVFPWGKSAVKYWFDAIIARDFSFVGIAAMAVAVVMVLMTRSLLLTVAGLIHIMMSYFASWGVFLLFGYRVFPGLIQMVMFLILGIGADDVFVMLDAWKRTHQETTSNVNESLAIKISVVIRRAAMAMFVTTFTTFAAFAAIAVSPVPAISAFGIYASACIVFDYVFVVTWFPAVLLIWHRFFEFRTIAPISFSPLRCTFWDLDVPETLTYHPLYAESQRRKAERLARDTKVVAPVEEAEEPADAAVIDVVSQPRVSSGVKKQGSLDDTAEETDDLIPRKAPVPGRGGFARRVPRWICAVDRYFSTKGWLGTALVAAREAPLEAEQFDANTLSFVERFFHFYLFPLVRLFRVPILLFYLILFVVTAIYAVQLEPAGQHTIAFPDDEPMAQASRLLTEAFKGSSDQFETKEVCFVYGVDHNDPIDRDGIDPNAADYLGAPVFDEAFVATPELFEKAAGTCVRMVETSDASYREAGKEPGAPGSRPAVNIDVTTALLRDIPCVALVFVEWARSGRVFDPEQPVDWSKLKTAVELPPQFKSLNASALAQVVEEFTQSPAGAPYSSHVGFLRPEATVTGAMRVPERVRWLKDCYPVIDDARKAANDDTVSMWAAFAEAERIASGTNFLETSSIFMRVSSKKSLRESTYASAGLSLVLVFVVMMLFSGSIPIAILVTICITQILVFVFAYMVWRGWPLDFVESIALTVLVGISVDFTVHYGVAYQEAEYMHRQRRMRFAMTSMGTSISSGALTTLSSAALLFAATFEFFTKFGEFLFITISLSWVVANTLFPALAYYFGPTGHFGDIHYALAQCSLSKKVAGSDMEPVGKGDGGGVPPAPASNSGAALVAEDL